MGIGYLRFTPSIDLALHFLADDGILLQRELPRPRQAWIRISQLPKHSGACEELQSLM